MFFSIVFKDFFIFKRFFRKIQKLFPNCFFHFFFQKIFSDLACGVTALKPCTQTGVCGACARSLAAYVAGSGLLQAPHCLFLVPFSVAGCSFSPSTSSEQRTTSRTTAIFPSQPPPFCSSFFQASRQVAVAFGFRHYWGVCLHLLLWSLLSHFFLHPVP